MILNILLLLLVFGAERKRVTPYGAAVLFGVIKGTIYAVFSGSLGPAIIMAVCYAGLAAGGVYFLSRLHRVEQAGVPNYRPPGAETLTFRWEYIPLAAILIVILLGVAIERKFLPDRGWSLLF